jgi:serine/threonine protein kinase
MFEVVGLLSRRQEITGLSGKSFRLVGSPIGAGGNGVVFKCLAEDGTHYAVKFYIPSLSRQFDSKALERFMREIQFLQNLQHPNIVKVFDQGLVRLGVHEIPFYVMELAVGTLRTRILSGFYPGDLGHWYTAIRDISSALAAVHNLACWHRDLKPENILIGGDGHLKLADFGLVHLNPDLFGQPDFTSETSILANRFYFAPEARRGQSDASADLFAAGLIFWEILTGEVPRGQAESPSSRLPKSDSRLDNAIGRLCRSDPMDRYESIQSFWLEFSELVEIAELLPDVADVEVLTRLLLQVEGKLQRFNNDPSAPHQLRFRVEEVMDGEDNYCDIWQITDDERISAAKLILRASRSNYSELQVLSTRILTALVESADRILCTYCPSEFNRADVVPFYPFFQFVFCITDYQLLPGAKDLQRAGQRLPEPIQTLLAEFADQVGVKRVQWSKAVLRGK